MFAGSSILPAPTIDMVDKDMIGREKTITYDQYSQIWENKIMDSLRDGTTHNSIEKCKDFIDRIDIMLCIPPICELLCGDETGREYIDIACLIIKKHFDKIIRVEQAVIMTLVKKLAETSSRRGADKCVFCSSVPDTDTFIFSMLPKRDQLRW